MTSGDRARDVSLRAAGGGCIAGIAAFVAPFLLAWLVLPYALGVYIRWTGGHGENESPEILNDLFFMGAGPFLFVLCMALGYVLGGLAFVIVSQRLHTIGRDGSTRH